MSGHQVMVKYRRDKVSKKRVYYTGSDTLKAGYALCYDRDDILATDRAGTVLTAAYESWARHQYVEKPATGNLHNFAGLVAEESHNVTGPNWISIEEPNGRAHIGFCQESCTAFTLNTMGTLLTVQAASYYLGAIGEGMLVGYAIQTKDRSTTAGTVQMVLTGVNPAYLIPKMGTPTSALNVFSSAIWESCPWAEMMIDPSLGYTFFDDFISAPVLVSATAQGPYLTYQDVGVTIRPLETKNEVGGVIEVANNDADNDEGHLGLGSGAEFNLMKIATAGKPCWFEARFKKAGIGDNGVALFVGVGEEGFIAAEGLVDDTGEVADKDFVGFQVLHAAGESLVPCYKKEGQTKQSGTGVDMVADTYINAGFAFNGTTMEMYINNVSKKSVTAANIAAATFPGGEEMTLMLLSKVGAAAELAVHADWWRFAQLR